MNKAFRSAVAIVLTCFIYSTKAAPLGSVPCTAKAQAFWSEFRDAALNYDTDKVIRMTKFPFVVKGELDWVRVEKLNKNRFKKFWPLILAYGGDLPSSVSMFEIAQNTPRLKSEEGFCTEWGSVRVEDWEFELTQGEYKFTRAYLNSTIERPR